MEKIEEKTIYLRLLNLDIALGQLYENNVIDEKKQ